MANDLREGFVRQRRNLIISSLVLIFAQASGLTITKLNIFGNELGLAHPYSVITALWIATWYWAIRYYQYFTELKPIGIKSAYLDKFQSYIAILTFILAKETWYLREAQIQQLEELKRENIRPNIGIQLTPNPAGFNLFDIKITNHGKGIAKKISIKFLDQQGNEVSEDTDIVVSEFRKLAMLRLGIQTMGIGQEISSFVFSFHELSEKLKGDIFSPFIHIAINFEDVSGYSYSNSFTIDFAQFQGMSEVGGNSLYKLSNEIKKIREVLERATRRNGGRVSVDMFTSEDREVEAEKARQWIEDQRLKDN